MADKVYSFTKIEKRRTYAGEFALIGGICSLVFLGGLIAAGITVGGTLNKYICSLAYFSLSASVIGWIWAAKAISKVSVSGRYLHAGRNISMISALLHIGIFMTGVLKVIL